MHGLVNHAVQCFVRDAYGAEAWRKVSRAAGVGPDGFEPMLDYDDHVTHELLLAADRHLGKAPEALLEDLGTYLVSHDSQRSVRRLLRFSGATFSDFLHALDDLPSRAKLAMPDLDLPELELREDPPGCFRLFVLARQPAWGYVMLGLLRAMADDFGALVVIDIAPSTSSVTVIEISLHDGAFAAGRSFSLAGAEPAAPAPLAPPRGEADSADGAHGAPAAAPGGGSAPPSAGSGGGSDETADGPGGDLHGPPGAGATGQTCRPAGPGAPHAEGPGAPGAEGPGALGTDGSSPGASDAGGHGAGRPGTGGPVPDEAHSGGPTTGRPTMGGPKTGRPTMGGPKTGKPTTGKPTTDGPTTGKPTTDGPTMGERTTGGPRADRRGRGGAETGRPGPGSAAAIHADDPVERVLSGAVRDPAAEDRP